MTNDPWSNIETPRANLNVRRVSATHPLPLYWGKDQNSACVFVVEIPADAAPAPKSLPNLVGVRVSLFQDKTAPKLVFVLADAKDREIFFALCMDLIHASENADSSAAAVAIILRRLARWREFLKRPHNETMTESRIKGLIGELLFLENTLAARFGWEHAVSFWKGPENAAQDFIVYDTAVEVKCQSGSSRPFVEIASVEQLNSRLPRLYLVVHTLSSACKDDTDAITLNSLARRILTAMELASDSFRDAFETLLFRAGWAPIPDYDEKAFRLVSTRAFEVRDGFPRLMPDTIPEGVEKITYNLSLAALAPFSTSIEFTQTAKQGSLQ